MELIFDVTEQRIGDIPVVAVRGEIDVATAPALRDHLVAHEAAATPVVVIDLTAVSFVDSTALGVLVGSYRRLRDGGGSLRLVVAEPRILKVFEITDLIRVIPIFGTVDEALAVDEALDG